MSVYPPVDIVKVSTACDKPAARIAAVQEGSPAWEQGFEPGCYITSVNGSALRDIIDWRWLTADEQIVKLGYRDLDGDSGFVELEREEGENWGIEFDGVIFDHIKLCRNACSFCFMQQLPPHARPSLSMRDDDFRLSFLAGTFVSLSNLTEEDEARIIEQRISPLRVSLHALDSDVRAQMIGKHAHYGLSAFEKLLEAGIEAHVQIVLVPGVNDGEVLRQTLEWAYERPGILNLALVPLGYTRYQQKFTHSFNKPEDALAVIEALEPFQQRALTERNTPWVFAADEFYRNAYGEQIFEKLPPASHYGDFSMFEDGVGIIRSYFDEFEEACKGGLAQRAAELLDAYEVRVLYVVGEAMQPFLDSLIAQSPLADRLVPLTVKNEYYGGNVDVTGLLCAYDIVPAIKAVQNLRLGNDGKGSFTKRVRQDMFVVPSVIFNDEGVTLDDVCVADMEKAAGVSIAVVSCNPLDYLTEIISIVTGDVA